MLKIYRRVTADGYPSVVVDIHNRDRIRGVEILEEAFSDPEGLRLALDMLNRNIAGWPVEPVTCEQVEALL